MSKTDTMTCATCVNPITPELARQRRDALASVLKALKADITLTHLTCDAETDTRTEFGRESITPDEYAGLTDLYSAGERGVEYATACYRLLDGILQLPACVIVRTAGDGEGAEATLDTAVFDIKRGWYDDEELEASLARLEEADQAIEDATVRYLVDRGVAVERYLIDEEDVDAVRHIDLGAFTPQAYADRVRLRDNWAIQSYSLQRTWEPTPVGWLVTEEQSDPTGKMYGYQLAVAETE